MLITGRQGIRVAVMAFAFAAACTVGRSTYRTDDLLIANLRAHKSEFNALLEMFRSDRQLMYIVRDRTIPSDPLSAGINPERSAQYKRLFAVIGLTGMAAADRVTGSRDEVWFFTSVEGRRESTFKHYAYVINPARGVIVDLDRDGSKTNPYRHIEDNWYLALDDAD